MTRQGEAAAPNHSTGVQSSRGFPRVGGGRLLARSAEGLGARPGSAEKKRRRQLSSSSLASLVVSAWLSSRAVEHHLIVGFA